MLFILLKSSLCLLAFLLFYKLLLEKENMHVFKRVYLLTAILTAIVIPFITFTNYIEAIPQVIMDSPLLQESIGIPNIIIEEKINYTPYILWSLYGIITSVFMYRFSKNIFSIWKNIKNNSQQKTANTVLVLVEKPMLPQTFFKYIFLNKTEYTNKLIPETVLQHEATHARQMHSLDVLIIELQLVAFWFNPLLYVLRNSIKLNHEFLADQAVLKEGVLTQQYQKTLLAFSSNAQYNQLANAINYSSIKKRLTVMKTQTTTKTKWVKTVLIIPLVALLLFSFSNTKEVIISSVKTPILKITKNPNSFTINGKITTLDKLKSDFIKITKGEKSDLQINTKGEINMNLIIEIQVYLRPYLNKILLADGAYINGADYEQQKASAAQVAEYNTLAKKYNVKSQGVIHLKDLKRLEYLYGLMSKKQKENAEPYPNHPPKPSSPIIKKGENSNIPPPAPPSKKDQVIASIDGGKIGCNNCLVELSKEKVANIQITAGGLSVTSYRIKFPGNPTLVVKGSKLNKKALSFLQQSKIGDKIMIFDIKTKVENSIAPMTLKIKSNLYSNTDDYAVGHGAITDLLPPPPPPQAPKVKKGDKSNLLPPPPPPHAPMTSFFNGVKSDGNILEFTRGEIINGKVSIEGKKVKTFLIKFRGKPTVSVKGNQLNGLAKKYLKQEKEGLIQIFAINQKDKITVAPILLKIKK